MQAVIVETADILPCQKDNVHGWKLGLQQTEVFTHTTLDAVAVDGQTDFLLGDDETQAGMRCG